MSPPAVDRARVVVRNTFLEVDDRSEDGGDEKYERRAQRNQTVPKDLKFTLRGFPQQAQSVMAAQMMYCTDCHGLPSAPSARAQANQLAKKVEASTCASEEVSSTDCLA